MKHYLRNRFLKERKGLKNRLNKKFSQRICSRLASQLEGQEQHILLYYPIRAEPNVLLLEEHMKGSKAKFYLPRCVNNSEMEIVPYKRGDVLTPDHMKIPSLNQEIEAVEAACLTTILVPGLSFDRDGHRLGYGKGYYDRFLAEFGAEVLKVGVCFSFQMSQKSLPSQKHDFQIDSICHENAWLDLTQS